MTRTEGIREQRIWQTCYHLALNTTHVHRHSSSNEQRVIHPCLCLNYNSQVSEMSPSCQLQSPMCLVLEISLLQSLVLLKGTVAVCVSCVMPPKLF